jgi:hypothetical protein
MKTLREKINRQGKREVTVVLEDEDHLMCFRDDRHYQLGGQVGDIMAGHVITESECVYWCSIEQGWMA